MTLTVEPESRRWWDADGGWTSAPGAAAGTVLVVDSWLVEDGRVRGLDRHARRFGASCARFGVPVDAFIQAVASELPTTGRWFPRVELAEIDTRATSPTLVAGRPSWHPGTTTSGTYTQTRLRLWLRPAPPRTATVRLWTAPHPDRRRHPAVKGPDLDHLAALRAAAIQAGADEALLLTRSGHVLEGSTTSIVWWRGETLCTSPGALPGVTLSLLTDLATAAGHPVVLESATPAGLSDCPVWTLNALHGIRPVTEGLGRFQRADGWQSRLEALALPVRPGGAHPDVRA